MFADILHLTQLETFGFPATTITSDTAIASGNMGAIWNYGASDTNDMGALGDAATEYKTAHAGGVGAFGIYGVDDSNYDSTSTALITPCTIPTLKPQTPRTVSAGAAPLSLHQPEHPPLGCRICFGPRAFSAVCFGRPLRTSSTPNLQQARAPPAPCAAANRLKSAPAFEQTVLVSSVKPISISRSCGSARWILSVHAKVRRWGEAH
jgi:hypothetical protein